MKIDLPSNTNMTDAADARTLIASATAGSTHSMYKSAAYTGGPDVAFALPRMFDPARRGMMANNMYGTSGTGLDILRFDDDPYVRQQVILACRNIAKTHPVTNAAINVYSRFPIQGIRLQHADADIERYYTELFLEDLDFFDFFIDLGRSYWTDGTAFVFGNWSEDLGLWVGEDLLDPLTMDIRRIPFVAEDLIYMIPQPELKEFVRGQTPEGMMFRQKFPEMADAIATGEDILLSSDRVTVIANKDKPSDLWGTPNIMRSWNTLRLEDRMQAAMQATADRLYAPLIMFTIDGQLPDGTQYIPSAAALDAFRSNLDAALASDFRAIVTHSGVQSNEVIRRDTMNSFKQDIDMYDERIFMAWGLTPTILKPDKGTYATSALEFQLVTQLLSSYQKTLIKVYEKQAAFVAEAQEHFEYEKKGDSMQVVKEKREVWNEESGTYEVKEVPKLSYPKMVFDVINFRDEQKEREFRMALRNAGVPIADSDIAIGVDIDLKDSADKYQEEQIHKKVQEAEREDAIFRATMKQGITVPPDTKKYLDSGIAPMDFQDVLEKFKTEGSDEYDDSLMERLDTDFQGSQPSKNMSSDSSDVSSRPDVSDEQRSDAPKA